MKFRPLNDSEIDKLKSYIDNTYSAKLSITDDEHRQGISSRSMCIESYKTGCPGYSGNLYFISYESSPEYYEVFDKDFNPIPQAEEINRPLEKRHLIYDGSQPSGAPQKLKINSDDLGIGIAAEGYTDCCSDDGQIVFIEKYEKELRVLIWADIDKEEPTHIVSLEGARKSASDFKDSLEIMLDREAYKISRKQAIGVMLNYSLQNPSLTEDADYLPCDKRLEYYAAEYESWCNSLLTEQLQEHFEEGNFTIDEIVKPRPSGVPV